MRRGFFMPLVKNYWNILLVSEIFLYLCRGEYLMTIIKYNFNLKPSL